METPPVTPQKRCQESPSCSPSDPFSCSSSTGRKRPFQDASPDSSIAGLQLLTPPTDGPGRSHVKRPCRHVDIYPSLGASLIDHNAYGCISQLSSHAINATPRAATDVTCEPYLDLGPANGREVGHADEYQDLTFKYLLREQRDVSPLMVRANTAEGSLDKAAWPYSSSDPAGCVDAEVCYGMIRLKDFDPIINASLLAPNRNVHVVSDVQLASNSPVILRIGSSIAGQGSVPERTRKILSRLQQQNRVTIQFSCVITRVLDAVKIRKDDLPCHHDARLSAIIYGPASAFNSIGEFLEACGPDFCLQDPQGCDRNVPYRNPHRLTGWDDDVPMTCDRAIEIDVKLRDTRDRGTDDWDEVALHKDLPHASTPSALQSHLYPYQSQALYFMRKRERGWNWQDDIWVQDHHDGHVVYRNTLTDEDQLEQPSAFRGGLLADQMGLGKTLTIIALIASDLTPLQSTNEPRCVRGGTVPTLYSSCTLVVVPPNLLATWDFQLTLHTKPGELKWTRHHDSSRYTMLHQLEPFNIVLTTYNTVATEWRSRRQKSLLYSTHWHRIVLDEAHCIRGERTQLAKAIFDLKADRRWAVTGTPIQNHLSDLEALLKFLRLDPYNDCQRFEKDMVKYWKIDPQLAVGRLKRLISCITLRRTSKAIDLPARIDKDELLTFNDEERARYDAIEDQILAPHPGVNARPPLRSRLRGHKVHGLHLLRFICNFGTEADTSHFRMDDGDEIESAWKSSDAQKLFNTMSSSGMTKCARCMADATVVGDRDVGVEPSIFAGESASGWCGCNPVCPALPIPLAENDVQEPVLATKTARQSELPTKTKVLIADILLHPESKSVVFSAWRTTLDLAERGLAAAGILYTRFDGEVKNQAARASALEKFRSDDRIKVILITLSCGAVGLDLTVADRAYMMEPQWNPTVEEQALARIHRMGQKKPVTTVRYIMGDSIENKVIDVQTQKRNFADILLSASRKRSPLKASVGTYSRWQNLLK